MIDSYKNNLKITDIFSYLPAQEISIKHLEKIFIDTMNGKEHSHYMVFHDTQNIELSTSQILATNELILTKNVAYISHEDIVVAVVAYQKNSYTN